MPRSFLPARVATGVALLMATFELAGCEARDTGAVVVVSAPRDRVVEDGRDARADDVVPSPPRPAPPTIPRPTAPPPPVKPTTTTDAGAEEPYWQTQRRRLEEARAEEQRADAARDAGTAGRAEPAPATTAKPPHASSWQSSPTADADRARRCEADFNRCMEHAKAVFAWTQQQTQPDGALLSYELALATAIERCELARAACATRAP